MNNPVFQELVNELSLCESSGIFLALYQNKTVIESVSKRLKESLPDYFVLPIEMDSKEAGFTALLDRDMGKAGENRHIFHIIEVDRLTDSFRRNFLDYLRYTRERFKDKPYAFVFWVTPEIEKQLFYSAADFQYWITATYDFTGTAVSESPKPKKKPVPKIAGGAVNKTIADQLEKVVWQYENWEAVRESGTPFIIEAMGNADLNAYYLPPNCETGEGTKPLGTIAGEFLDDESKTLLVAAGDANTGKTSFAIRLYVDIARRYIADGGKIPIYIPLGHYRGRIGIRDIIKREFYERFGIGLSSNIFQNMAIRGKFVFIADGFDKMAASSNYKPAAENLRTLSKLTLENIRTEDEKKANKIVLTCGAHYVFENVGEKFRENRTYSQLFKKYGETPDCLTVRIDPEPLDEKMLEAYIVKTAGNGDTVRMLLDITRDENRIREFCPPDLIAGMIARVLPDLKGKTELNISDIYHAYTAEWIERDDWRSWMKSEGKRAFMWQLALKMFKAGGDYSLVSRKLERPVRSHIKDHCKYKEQDFYKLETDTCAFLNLDEDGHYRFVHKSFMEYFLADYYFDHIRNKRNKEISYASFNKAARFFLGTIITSNKHDLGNTDLSSLSLEKTDLSKANLAGAKLQRAMLNDTDLSEANLREADLTRTNLRNTKFENADLARAKLVQADLTNANLTNADMTESDLQRAKLNDSDLTEAKLGNSKLNDADLTNANLEKADLSEADLRWVNLRRAKFSEANLSGASLLRANLNETDFFRANLQRANLGEADLTRASLVEADLNWANLSKANLSESVFDKANLTRANLQKANIQRAEFVEVNLQKANLIKADVRWANLQRSDLTGADLWQANLNESDLTGAVYEMGELEKGYIEGAKLE